MRSRLGVGFSGLWIAGNEGMEKNMENGKYYNWLYIKGFHTHAASSCLLLRFRLLLWQWLEGYCSNVDYNDHLQLLGILMSKFRMPFHCCITLPELTHVESLSVFARMCRMISLIIVHQTTLIFSICLWGACPPTASICNMPEPYFDHALQEP